MKNLPTREEVRKHPKNKLEGKPNGKHDERVNGKLNSSVKRKRTEEEVQRNPSKRSAKSDENNTRVKYSRNEKISANSNGFSEHKELNGIETLEECEDEDDSSSSSSEVSFLKRSFDLKLPNKLRHILVFDHDMITYRQSLPTLPASKSVTAIVDEYLAAAKQTKRGRRSIYLDDTFKFLVNVFNDLLDTALIYTKEKPQVNNV